MGRIVSVARKDRGRNKLTPLLSTKILVACGANPPKKFSARMGALVHPRSGKSP